ncbi:MAG: ArsR/SmtB family transcription factor [Halobacteriales archaeon]
MSKEWEPETLFDVLASDHARDILALTSVRAMSAQELADHCDTSLPTIYRRINALLEYDLLQEETQIDEDGNHYKTFETNLERIVFEINDGAVDIDIELRKDLVDQFDEFWHDLEERDNSPETDRST